MAKQQQVNFATVRLYQARAWFAFGPYKHSIPLSITTQTQREIMANRSGGGGFFCCCCCCGTYTLSTYTTIYNNILHWMCFSFSPFSYQSTHYGFHIKWKWWWCGRVRVKKSGGRGNKMGKKPAIFNFASIGFAVAWHKHTHTNTHREWEKATRKKHVFFRCLSTVAHFCSIFRSRFRIALLHFPFGNHLYYFVCLFSSFILFHSFSLQFMSFHVFSVAALHFRSRLCCTLCAFIFV